MREVDEAELDESAFDEVTVSPWAALLRAVQDVSAPTFCSIPASLRIQDFSTVSHGTCFRLPRCP